MKDKRGKQVLEVKGKHMSEPCLRYQGNYSRML